MREIRFRAWDRKNRKMFFEIEHLYDNLGREPDQSCMDRSFGEVLDNHDFCVMQWTGLKDKNGVDIYEGDILGVDGESFGAVNWCEDCAAWGIGSKDLMLCEYAYSKFEVIGNIHQNPELLDGC